MCKRTAIEHGWGWRMQAPPHRAREEKRRKKNDKGEERGELEERGGERGARAREDWQRRGTTAAFNGTGDADGGMLMCIGKVQTQ